jgi:CHASE3 domain sensor protein
MADDNAAMLAQIRDAIREHTSEYKRISEETLKGQRAIIAQYKRQIVASKILAVILMVFALTMGYFMFWSQGR